MKTVKILKYTGRKLESYMRMVMPLYMEHYAVMRVMQELGDSIAHGALTGVIGLTASDSVLLCLQCLKEHGLLSDACLLTVDDVANGLPVTRLKEALQGVTERYIIIACIPQVYDVLERCGVLLEFSRAGKRLILTGETPVILTYMAQGMLKESLRLVYVLPLLYTEHQRIMTNERIATIGAYSNVDIREVYYGTDCMERYSISLVDIAEKLVKDYAHMLKWNAFAAQLAEESHERSLSINVICELMSRITILKEVKPSKRAAIRVLQRLHLLDVLYTPQTKKTMLYPVIPRLCMAYTKADQRLIDDRFHGALAFDQVLALTYPASARAAFYVNTVTLARAKGYGVVQYEDKAGHSIDLIVNKGNGHLLCINLVVNLTAAQVTKADESMSVADDTLMHYCDEVYSCATAPIFVERLQVLGVPEYELGITPLGGVHYISLSRYLLIVERIMQTNTLQAAGVLQPHINPQSGKLIVQ